ncbi:dehydrogenase/reductase SDR family member 4 isoform X3 [Ochotona curzoniae]|uniref:dehydrogenase/reductase SDR family member 4 isoform X3 n=1 Tax=Ochotona curzoniae TaxID=130825 RepID=UPI001B3508B8|nr:dehydrogenase/reductase SDR family member 4 isoform X3 [Ochotona curzoniae]
MQKAQVLLSGCARTWKSVRMASSGATLRNTLANKVAIVTASTDGIGLAIARRLAQDGAHVVISSRKQQNVDRTVAALKQEGLSVSGTVCHVGKAEDRKRLVATILDINVKATALLTKEVVPEMEKRGGGSVVIVASIAAFSPFTFWKDAAQEEQAKQVMRVKRLGNPEECGGIVSFLCSEDASYINGETVVVGGGSPSRL